MGTTFLEREAAAILALGNYRVILCNAIGALLPDTDPAEILAAEVVPTEDGYASVAYLPASGAYNSVSLKWEWADVSVGFTEAIAGSGYQFTDVVLWQGRGAVSSKPIASIDAIADTITCTAHGLIDGDFSFVASEGVLPDGLTIQRYYTEVIDTNTVKLHTTETLDSPVDLIDEGIGALRLVHANGAFVDSQNFGLTTVNPGGTQSFIIRWKRRYG